MPFATSQLKDTSDSYFPKYELVHYSEIVQFFLDMLSNVPQTPPTLVFSLSCNSQCYRQFRFIITQALSLNLQTNIR